MPGKKGSIHYKNLNDINNRIIELYGKDRFIIEEDFEKFKYENVHQHIHIKCNKCGHTYLRRINSILHKYDCKYCAGRYFENSNDMKNYVKESTNGEYELISDTYKTRDIGTFIHNNSNCRNESKIFSMKIHNFTVLKQRCPYCNSTSKGIILSKGNIKIREYLEKHNIEFLQEYKIPNCKNPSKNILLSFDLYIPSYKLLIEYDGEQHFHPIEYFGGENTYKKTIKNDKIKNDFIFNNKEYNLLRIKYTDFSKIDKILDKTFNDHRKDSQRWINIYGEELSRVEPQK